MEEMSYFFAQMDINGDGKVSKKEFEKTMEEFGIPFSSMDSQLLRPTRGDRRKRRVSTVGEETFDDVFGLSKELSIKVFKCFEKISSILENKRVKLSSLFASLDSNKDR